MIRTSLEKLKERNNKKHDENQYINLIQDIIEQGVMIEGRNGNALTVFGAAMHFNLKDNILPVLTTKKVAIKTCIKELLWFISGETNNKVLKNQNVHIWDGNGSREFLDSRGLNNLEEDDLGPVYGHQWRYFNAPYTVKPAAPPPLNTKCLIVIYLKLLI